MRILSIDLGEVSLGTSISDPSNIIAIPLENYMLNERGNLQEALTRVIELVKEYNVGMILLGHPLRTDGLKSDMTYMSEEFYELLKENLSDVKIKLFDERFSTQRGVELLKGKYSEKEIKEKKDMVAAYVMLVDYLSTM